MTSWKNRIVGHGEEAPDQLLANPKNWRIHPKAQQDGLSEELSEIGWVQQVMVNQRTGFVVDGHLRVALAISRNEPSVPVLYVDLSEEEEARVLATLDPLAGMAVTDPEKLSDLLGDIGVSNDLLRSIAEDAGIGVEKDKPPELALNRFELIIDCADPRDLEQMYLRTREQGYACRTVSFQLPEQQTVPPLTPVTVPGEIRLRLQSDVEETYRTSRVRGMFELSSATSREFTVQMTADIDSVPDWRVGVITGASGAGKSSVARSLFPAVIEPDGLVWSERSILDDFKPELEIEEITSALTAVGFSSTPNWLSPYRVLSFGERFRTIMARAILEAPREQPLVIDEFTSVVDRTVAKVCATAVAATVRRRNLRFVAVTCHRDIIPWLEPDWVIDLDDRRFLQQGIPGRPGIELCLYPAGHRAWPLFKHAHYLSAELSKSATCFVSSVQFADERDERLAGFISFIPAMGRAGWARIHRQVVLPDFQGIGIGAWQQAEACEYMWDAKGK